MNGGVGSVLASVKILSLLGLMVQSGGTDPGPHNALHPVSPQGGHIEWLFWVIFWICAAVYVAMIAGFSSAAAKSEAGADDPPPIIEDEEGDRRASWFVGAATGITVLTLFIVLMVSVAAEKRVAGAPKQNAVTIQVTGHQWWWEFTYPNSQQPDQTINTANEIHVPVGVPIVMLTKSADVIHSFWVPSITGKRDLIPGISSAFSFEVRTPGFYHGQCAEFCGLQHAHMGFAVIADTPEDFAAWEQQQLNDAAEPTNPEQALGKKVFLTHACLMCHTIQGTDAGSRMGPDLTHIASRRMIAAETLPNIPGALGAWIIDPQHVKPGNHMAPNGMRGDELEALIAYLQSLK